MNHYKVAFISLGCDKNRINCEQMMFLAQAAGHQLLPEPEEGSLYSFSSSS